jgi:glycosyltransferase 2 family protein
MRIITDFFQNLLTETDQNSTSNNKYFKKILFNGVKFGISLFLLFFLIRNLKWKEIYSAAAHINWYYIFALVPLSISGQIICAIKWWYLVRKYNPKVKITNCIELYFIGSYINNFLPSTIGGDFGRAGLLSKKENISFFQCSISVIVERITGFAILLILACIGSILFMSKAYNSIIIIWSVCCFAGAVIILMFFFTPVFNKITGISFLSPFNNLLNKLLVYKGNYRLLASSFLFSLLFYVIELLTHKALLLQFDFHISFVMLLFVIPVIYFAVNLPFTINGIGIRENSYALFLGLIGIPLEIAICVSLIIFFYTIVQGILGGVLLIKYII